MELDPIHEDIRGFLVEHFTDVRDEVLEGGPSQADRYVFALKTSSGQARRLSVHRNFSTFPATVSDYLREIDVAGRLENGDVELCRLT
jgi:hypothetical protein